MFTHQTHKKELINVRIICK